MRRLTLLSVLSLAAASSARADLNTLQIYTGHVGLSVDAVGGADDPVGAIQASIPANATVLNAYLYSAGTPFPFYSSQNNNAPDSPTLLTQYNGAGITLGGMAVNDFNALVGATSSRPDIGQWFTARADVTAQVNQLRQNGQAGQSSYSWNVSEGSLNGRIDGELLAIAYRDNSDPNLQGSIVLLDGGQRTGGETKKVNFAGPVDPNAPGFKSQLSLGISFSSGESDQLNTVLVNGKTLTTTAGGFDDGDLLDGAEITAGGIGDTALDPNQITGPNNDHELYSLNSFIKPGDTSLTLFTQNPSDDDNLFFAALQFSAEVREVVGAPDAGDTLPLLGVGIASLSVFAKRKARLS